MQPLFKARLSFQAKVLIPVVAVMVMLIAATVWLISGQVRSQFHERAVRELDTSRKIFASNQKQAAANLLATYRHIVTEPRFRAITGLADKKTIEEFLPDALHNQIDDDGAVIATFTFFKETGPEVAEVNLDPQLNMPDFEKQSALAFEAASKGDSQVDTICLGTNLLRVIALPIRDNRGAVSAVLTFGVHILPSEAQDIKQVTRSEILFLKGNQVLASSVSRSDWNFRLAGHFDQLSQQPGGAEASQTTEIVLGNEHFLCQAGRFPSLSNAHQLGYVLLSTYYGESTSVLKATQQIMLGIGALGIVLGVLSVWFLVGRVTRPLRQLRDSAEAVGKGDFSNRVEVTSHDECGELAVVFNQMTANIKASRDELEKTVETLKNTQNQLIQSEKLSGIGEFVAGVAHELNNPLTSVMGFAELLQQMEMPEQSRRYLDVIFKSAKRCQKIVASLLSFARRHAPERKVLCVNEVVESAVEILHYQMRTSNIEVITQLDPALPLSEIDSHQMQQVFLNIINNARQAIEAQQAKGWLRITTETVGNRVRITFQDSGPGIPAENLNKIFNPFFTTKEVGKGTGLGLSLCYGIVSEHGGTITPQSREGEGATFVIELPVSSAKATAADKKATVQLPATTSEGIGKRVLVIDDEDTILQMIREVLEFNGYRVDVARDGEAALRRIGQYHYDLALCDWKMPGMNGQQVYERLQSTNPEMSHRVIFITGDTVNDKTHQFLQSEHKVCLSKPFTLVEFRSAINRVMSSGGRN